MVARLSSQDKAGSVLAAVRSFRNGIDSKSAYLDALSCLLACLFVWLLSRALLLIVQTTTQESHKFAKVTMINLSTKPMLLLSPH